ncbi:hypothetical protein EVAR_46925_1 [Eumeta japonica]|uniref:Uncharacterized protein n=1 Tax=Eumeta variegata TaxID=151549 RepID=A0A4C1Y2H3_EUMVA|nr:hypothetical protein EVAR_46925_1 [Eumeta japonica]
METRSPKEVISALPAFSASKTWNVSCRTDLPSRQAAWGSLGQLLLSRWKVAQVVAGGPTSHSITFLDQRTIGYTIADRRKQLKPKAAQDAQNGFDLEIEAIAEAGLELCAGMELQWKWYREMEPESTRAVKSRLERY